MSAVLRPLEGVSVLLLGGIGPAPFAAMILADLGATVTRLERPTDVAVPLVASHLILRRGEHVLECNLKSPDGQAKVRELFTSTDLVIEGFRPGVVERLGVGPAEAKAANPAIVYGRMTGWGQDGPLAHSAGHDINYISLSGALEPIAAEDGTPVPPLNFMGDFGGGSMYLVAGLLSALLRAAKTGEGAVVDAAIVDGAASLTAMLHSMRADGSWMAGRRNNLLDGGAPFYRVYRTRDDRWIAVGSIEPKFYSELLRVTGLAGEISPATQNDRSTWPDLHHRFAEVFASKNRDEWAQLFDGVDACVCEVIAPDEVLDQPHLAARRTYTDANGYIEPAPAPRVHPL